MGVEQEPLPDASDLIRGLDEMLKGGGKLFSEPLSPLQETITTPTEEGHKIFYMNSFFTNYFPIMPTGHPREEAQKLFQEFPALKDNLITNLERTKDIQSLEVVRGITLGKLAGFAKERHEAFAKDAGRSEINSQGFQNSRTFAEYWSRLEEITRSASEMEKNERG